jgi:hypothetical protein
LARTRFLISGVCRAIIHPTNAAPLSKAGIWLLPPAVLYLVRKINAAR